MRKFLIGAFLVATLSACGPAPISSASPSPAGSPSAPASPTLPAGFACGGVTGGSVSDAAVSAVKIEQHAGYDRFVIEFGGGIPSYSIAPQTSTIFMRSPKGDQVTLEGTAGVLVIVHSVNNWTSYSGPTAFHPQYPFLREAMQVENYEGYQQWALGIQGTPCFRVATLSSPNRLVVDVAAT